MKAWLELNVAEDANRGKGAPISIDIIDPKTKKRIATGERPVFSFRLSPGKERIFRVRSERYPRHQALVFSEGEER
jgi:hypothetical protein